MGEQRQKLVLVADSKIVAETYQKQRGGRELGVIAVVISPEGMVAGS